MKYSFKNEWMNEIIKSKLKSKKLFYKHYTQNGGKEKDPIVLENLITELNELISSTKALYYESLRRKLNNPLLQVKTTYSSNLKPFYNDKNSADSPSFDKQKISSGFRTKVNIFNKFFAEQCNPLKNISALPSSQEILTQKRLCFCLRLWNIFVYV